MQHGFTEDHFRLIDDLGGTAFDKSNAAHVAAHKELKKAWDATKAWAEKLKGRLFARGDVEMRNAPTNQRQNFTSYTWAKIYPWKGAPEQLSYTVGIDHGKFIVKIDTVYQTGDIRKRYEKLLGTEGFHNSPIADALSVRDGLNMSLEGLVDWSVQAVNRFELDYAEVAERIGIEPGAINLLEERDGTRAAFRHWHACLAAKAIERRGGYLVPEHGFVYAGEPQGDQSLWVSLGLDPNFHDWQVQINEPETPGSYNPTSAIGIDANGRRLLLRQGSLQENNLSPRIDEDIFVARTGLQPTPVVGAAARRRWFVVADLDAAPASIRRQTADFTRQCAIARGLAPPTAPTAELRRRNDERSGTYTRAARPAQGETEIDRQHGTVYLDLKAAVEAGGGKVEKWSGPTGHEIDAEITLEGGDQILVEIKTDIGAASLHGGVGQLHLYPRLMKQLARHHRILLLPDWPGDPMIDAITECGIEMHVFRYAKADAANGRATFSEDFLARCGVPPGRGFKDPRPRPQQARSGG